MLYLPIAVHYLLLNNDGSRNRAAAIAFLTVYFLLLLIMAKTYFRLLYVVQMDPGYLPLGAGARRNETRLQKKAPMIEKRAGPLTSQLHRDGNQTVNSTVDNNANGVGMGEYTPNSSTETNLGGGYENVSTDVYMDSIESQKALEEFWKRDVFVCMNDGKPKWCSDCAVWKTDRTHHCSDIGRCVKKMDHFCPW